MSAPPALQRPPDGVVVVLNDVGYVTGGGGWIHFLEAGLLPDAVHRLDVGKMRRPSIEKGTRVFLLRGGLIWCSVEAAGLENGVTGWSILFLGADIVRAKSVAIGSVVMAARWEATFKTTAPAPMWFLGLREPWWLPGDEREIDFARWSLADLSGEARMLAQAVAKQWPVRPTMAPQQEEPAAAPRRAVPPPARRPAPPAPPVPAAPPVSVSASRSAKAQPASKESPAPPKPDPQGSLF